MTEAVNEENSLWQNPKFIAYMGSTTFFNAGFSMQQLIISWLLVGVLLLPGDEVGLIQAAMGVPGLFLMLWGGASADNKDPPINSTKRVLRYLAVSISPSDLCLFRPA